MAYRTIQQEYMQIPPVTRAYTTACVLTTVAVVRQFWAPDQGGECRSASAALLIHRLGADNAKNLGEWDRYVLAAFEKKMNQRIDEDLK